MRRSTVAAAAAGQAVTGTVASASSSRLTFELTQLLFHRRDLRTDRILPAAAAAAAGHDPDSLRRVVCCQ